MADSRETEPRFPLRIIYDDGQLDLIDSAEALLLKMDGIDTAAERGHLWIRDDLGRTVKLRIVSGEVELIEAVLEPV
jgi:hypothetical protein